jgi:transcription antitermination factor NusG
VDAHLSSVFEAVPTGAERWVIAHTKSRQEKTLVTDLEAAGVSCYLPAVRELRTHGNRRRWVEMPLFTGYVFVLGGEDVSGTARRTGRVAGIIAVADQVRLVHELRQIHRAIEQGANLLSSPCLKAGVPARVARGALRGVEGVVESVVSSDRLVLVVHTLGRAIAVEVSPGDVEAI